MKICSVSNIIGIAIIIYFSRSLDFLLSVRDFHDGHIEPESELEPNSSKSSEALVTSVLGLAVASGYSSFGVLSESFAEGICLTVQKSAAENSLRKDKKKLTKDEVVDALESYVSTFKAKVHESLGNRILKVEDFSISSRLTVAMVENSDQKGARLKLFSQRNQTLIIFRKTQSDVMKKDEFHYRPVFVSEKIKNSPDSSDRITASLAGTDAHRKGQFKMHVKELSIQPGDLLFVANHVATDNLFPSFISMMLNAYIGDLVKPRKNTSEKVSYSKVIFDYLEFVKEKKEVTGSIKRQDPSKPVVELEGNKANKGGLGLKTDPTIRENRQKAVQTPIVGKIEPTNIEVSRSVDSNQQLIEKKEAKGSFKPNSSISKTTKDSHSDQKFTSQEPEKGLAGGRISPDSIDQPVNTIRPSDTKNQKEKIQEEPKFVQSKAPHSNPIDDPESFIEENLLDNLSTEFLKPAIKLAQSINPEIIASGPIYNRNHGSMLDRKIDLSKATSTAKKIADAFINQTRNTDAKKEPRSSDSRVGFNLNLNSSINDDDLLLQGPLNALHPSRPAPVIPKLSTKSRLEILKLKMDFLHRTDLNHREDENLLDGIGDSEDHQGSALKSFALPGELSPQPSALGSLKATFVKPSAVFSLKRRILMEKGNLFSRLTAEDISICKFNTDSLSSPVLSSAANNLLSSNFKYSKLQITEIEKEFNSKAFSKILSDAVQIIIAGGDDVKFVPADEKRVVEGNISSASTFVSTPKLTDKPSVLASKYKEILRNSEEGLEGVFRKIKSEIERFRLEVANSQPNLPEYSKKTNDWSKSGGEGDLSTIAEEKEENYDDDYFEEESMLLSGLIEAI
jgi:hypothetical protein